MNTILKPLYSQIDKILNKDINIWVTTIVDNAPVEVWKIPSASSHHAQDERTEWGNLRHTLRVVEMCRVLSDIHELGRDQAEILKAAAILHDIAKRGIPVRYNHTHGNHPHWVRPYIGSLGLSTDSHFNEILSLVEDHMGHWDKSHPEHFLHGASISLNMILHIADCTCAMVEGIIKAGEIAVES